MPFLIYAFYPKNEAQNSTPQNVSKWEKEGIRDIDTIKKLSQILGQDILSDERKRMFSSAFVIFTGKAVVLPYFY